jgi:hypothetical protein
VRRCAPARPLRTHPVRGALVGHRRQSHHYTLATSDICGKEAAARYARDTLGAQWERIASEALRIRRADIAGSTRPGMLAAALVEYTVAAPPVAGRGTPPPPLGAATGSPSATSSSPTPTAATPPTTA